ncbi:Anthranilate phosphoribosyltransferase like [hydrothermal vent metagenome]|uniref:Anthranilate phosphoribosyltransferase like n=1 Tax=hydrothermal vent metagenome TaxID=652676 RepID=A0A3B0ZWH1_9ZZZZ
MNHESAAAMKACIGKVATGPEYSKDLSFKEAYTAMQYILDKGADPVQAAVFFIALRMKRETMDENKGILKAIIDGANIVTADVDELVDVADPYNGHNRSLPICAFIPPVLAACGLPAVSHGLETINPKYGITTHKVLAAAGLNVNLSSAEAAKQIENPDIGWAYIDQQAYAPDLHSLKDLRERIIKRQVLTTVEVLIGPVRAKKHTHLLTGYVHKAYPPVYAELARFVGFDSGMIVRGVEGGVIPSLQQSHKVFGYTDNGEESPQTFDPTSIGIEQNTRAVPIPESIPAGKDDKCKEFDVDAAAAATAEAGIAALKGNKGTPYDSLVYSCAIVLAHTSKAKTGRAETLSAAADKVRKILDSGEAYTRFTGIK